MHPSRKVYHKRQGALPEPAHQTTPPINLINFPPPVRVLIQEQKNLQQKIVEINNRLRFGYSDALHDYQLELIKQNAHLSCQLSELL